MEVIAPKKTGEKCPECGHDLVERHGRYGKFVACDKLLMTDPIMNMTTIGYYEAYFDHKYLDIYGSVVVLNENQCRMADEYTGTTFFTDFIKEYNCNGMFIQIT